MVKPRLEEAFVAHLLALIEAGLPAQDGTIASTLVAEADGKVAVAHFLASMLFVYQAGRIGPGPRKIVQTNAFGTARAVADDEPELARLIAGLESGGPALDEARSREARRVLRRSKGKQFIFLDRCFLEWGVHHFHVHPKDRKRDRLVYAAFDDASVYLLALGTHASLNDQELVEAMSEVCPHLLSRLNGVTGDKFSVEEVKNLRRKNAGFATGSPVGAVVPRVLCSSAGLPLQIVRSVDFELAHLGALQRALEDPCSTQSIALQSALQKTGALTLSVRDFAEGREDDDFRVRPRAAPLCDGLSPVTVSGTELLENSSPKSHVESHAVGYHEPVLEKRPKVRDEWGTLDDGMPFGTSRDSRPSVLRTGGELEETKAYR